MGKKQIGFAVVGCGVVAQAYAGWLEGAADACLAGVCDVSGEHARKFGEENRVYFTMDYAELLRRADVDVVCLCTPSFLHAEQAVAAAAAGKHVLVEKPMATKLEDADRMIASCSKAGVRLGCVFQRRVIEPWVTVKKALDAGELGKLVLADVYMKWYRDQEYYDGGQWRGTWEFDGGGALMNQGIHFVDALLWLAGDVSRVFGRARTLARDIEVEDTVVSTVEFKNGAVGVIEVTTSVYPPGLPHRTEIHGDRGTIIIEKEDVTRWEVMGDDGGVREVLRELREAGKSISSPADVASGGHGLLIQDMARAVLEERDPVVPGCEGRRALEVVLATYESSRRGTDVELPLVT